MGDIVGTTLGSSVGALDGEVEGRIEPLIVGGAEGLEVGDLSVGVILIVGVELAAEGDVLGTPEGVRVPPSPVQKSQVFTHALPIS